MLYGYFPQKAIYDTAVHSRYHCQLHTDKQCRVLSADDADGEIDEFVTNIELFFSPKDNVLLVFVRYASVLVLILSGFFSFFTIKHGRVSKRENVDCVCLSSFLILLFTVMLNLLLYDICDWRDTRAIAPVLFVSILLLATHAGANAALKASVVTLAVISMFGFSQIFANAENRFNGNNPSDYSLIHAIKYDPDASSRWGNTILFNGFPPGSLNLDPGLGYSLVFFNDTESFKAKTQGGIKSRYVISYGALSDERLELMAEENGCFLYLNLTSENEKGPS